MFPLPHPLSSLLLFLGVLRRASASSALMLFSALRAEDASGPRGPGTSGRPSRSFATFALRLLFPVPADGSVPPDENRHYLSLDRERHEQRPMIRRLRLQHARVRAG